MSLIVAGYEEECKNCKATPESVFCLELILSRDCPAVRREEKVIE